MLRALSHGNTQSPRISVLTVINEQHVLQNHNTEPSRREVSWWDPGQFVCLAVISFSPSSYSLSLSLFLSFPLSLSLFLSLSLSQEHFIFDPISVVTLRLARA